MESQSASSFISKVFPKMPHFQRYLRYSAMCENVLFLIPTVRSRFKSCQDHFFGIPDEYIDRVKA